MTLFPISDVRTILGRKDKRCRLPPQPFKKQNILTSYSLLTSFHSILILTIAEPLNAAMVRVFSPCDRVFVTFTVRKVIFFFSKNSGNKTLISINAHLLLNI